MMIREPIVAGRFYPGTRDDCRADLQQRIPSQPDLSGVPGYPIGAIVPHAGWMCSGGVAGGVFAAIAISSLLSILLFLAVATIERLSLPWYYTTLRKERWEEVSS